MKGEVDDVTCVSSATEQKRPGPLRYFQPVVEKWSIRERLALATSVTQDNEQHWPSISKMVKPFASEKQIEDYFAPRLCARQYADMLESIQQPKRRGEASIYDCTPEEMLVKRLTLDRIEELQTNIKKLQTDYKKIKSEITSIESGTMDAKIVMRMFNELKVKELVPAEELIPVSESDLVKLTEAENTKESSQTTDAVTPVAAVITASQLGVPADDDYDTDNARIEESRREVLLAIVGPQMVRTEEVEIIAESSNQENEATCKDDEVSADEPSMKSEAPSHERSTEGSPKKMIKETQSQVSEDSPKKTSAPTRKSNEELRRKSFEESPKKSTSMESPKKASEESPKKSTKDLVSQTGDASLRKSVEESPRKSVDDNAPPHSPSASSFVSTPARHTLVTSEDDDEATDGEDDPEETLQVKKKSYQTWKKSINMIIRAAQSHKHASVFLSPVTDDIAAGYSQVISRPMDLSTIKRRVDNGEIRTTAEFQRDVMLMFTNAVMYNNAEHDVHKMALEMYDDVMSHIEQYLSTQVMSPNVESKVLRRRTSDHNEEEQSSRRRRGSTDSDKREEPPKKTRK